VESACLRLLARREFSRDELRRRLIGKGYPEVVLNEVIAGLAGEGAQSDARFAQQFASSRARKGHGPQKIKYELRQRGVSAEEESAIADIDWDEVIEAAYVKKFGAGIPVSLPELAAREQFLLRRGFGRERIAQLFRRLRRGEPDS
jgi:regulatory protein